MNSITDLQTVLRASESAGVPNSVELIKDTKLVNRKFADLPEEIMKLILLHADISSIENISLTNRCFRQYITTDHNFWEIIIKRDFSKFIANYPSISIILEHQSTSDKAKYFSILEHIILQQIKEIKLIKTFLKKSFYPENNVASIGITELLCAEDYNKFKNKLTELNKFQGLESTSKYLDVLCNNEQILTEINYIMMHAAVRRYAVQQNTQMTVNELQERCLYLNGALTRLTEGMVQEIFARDENITSISLEECNLCYLPKNFGLFSKLKILHAANNNITYMPEELCNLQDLEFLDLSNNMLSSFPDPIFNLTNLHTLFIGNRKPLPRTCPLHDEICQKTTGNTFTRLPASIINLKNLKFLNLQSVSLRELPLELSRLTNLQQIIVTHNEIRSISPEILLMPSLLSLLVFGNPIDEYLIKSSRNNKLGVAVNLQKHLQIQYQYCSVIAKAAMEATTMVYQGIAWAKSHPGEFITHVGVPLLAMYFRVEMQGQSEEPVNTTEVSISGLMTGFRF